MLRGISPQIPENAYFNLKHIKLVNSPLTTVQNRISEDSLNEIKRRSASMKSPKAKDGKNTDSDAIDVLGVAVSVYEYIPQREDELLVGIGERFNILSRSTQGWWIVEREGKYGWVPSGCLFEIEDKEDDYSGIPWQGVALFDYEALGPAELSIKKEENLLIYKKYQHWLVAESAEKKGWVPSTYISMDKGGSKE